MGKLLGAGEPGCQRLHAVVALQRVLRRDQPPHFVEAEAFQRFEADMTVAFVRGIERAAEQADAAARIARHARHRVVRGNQGLSVPLPRTIFLYVVSSTSPTGPRACMRLVEMPISA